ncbi:ATP-binding cassette domain-containing protein [Spiroplasma endosymbiont of Aspidapion aeneum]|uniref:ATP-binding cassette domain-containing protein n=1 Tax=Spiroplasma endosymbiont of Aspidapion aeneum TaxID=3066276 RepID=UPI00313B92E7
MLKVNNLTKTYGSTNVLNGISFELDDNQVLGIIGAKGAGKTTLVKCILQIINQDSGSINILFKEQHNQLENIRKTFYIPRIFEYNIRLKPDDFILYYASVKKDDKEIVLDNFKYYCNFFRVRLETINKKISDLTIGEQKIILLIMSLSLNVRLLIIEEPYENIDEKQTKIVSSILDTIKSLKISVIFTVRNENANKLQKFVDKLILIDKGKILKILDINKPK